MSSPVLLPAATWQSLALELLWVYDGVVPRVRQWSAVITVPPGVFFVQSGLAVMAIGDEEIRVKPGQAFFTAPGVRRQWFEANTRLLSVGLRSQWPEGAPLYQNGLNVKVPVHRLKRLHEATKELYATVHGAREEVTYKEALTAPGCSLESWSGQEAAFRQWFAVYVATLTQMGIQPHPRQGAGDRRQEQLREWLQNRPLDLMPDLGEMAQRLDLSPRRVHQLLSETLGMTAQAYHERRRLDHARQQLIHESTPLKEIAFSLGFRHPPHFSAWFKRHTGMTPTAFREGQGLEGA